MKQVTNKLKELFLTVASSYSIHWIILLILAFGITLNVFTITFYKVMCVYLCLAVLFVDINMPYKLAFIHERDVKLVEEQSLEEQIEEIKGVVEDGQSNIDETVD